MEQINIAGVPTTLIHFVFEAMVPPDTEGPPVPAWRIACMPHMKEFHATAYHPNYHRTNDTRAATCPACKKTKDFAKAQSTLEQAIKERHVK